MNDDPFERAQSVESAPSRALDTVLRLFFAATSVQTGVILALDRSEKKPTYRRLIHLFAEGANAGFLVAGEYVEVKELRLQKEPWLIPAIEVGFLGPVWQQFFGGDVLAVPICGKPLCPIGEASPAAATGLGAVALLGPIVGGAREWRTGAGKDRLAAIAAIAARCIGKRDAEQALELVVKAIALLPSNVEHLSALDFGVWLLRALRQAIPFRVGVLYLRPGGDRYLVYSGALGESDRSLLKSFWSQAERGVTWETMAGRQPVAGTIEDLPRIKARRTNDRPLEFVLAKHEIHKAWAVVPFIVGGQGIAVAHLEGVNGMWGLSRIQLEAAQILGAMLGAEIQKWEGLADLSLLPDVDLVSGLYTLLQPIELNGASSSWNRTQFEYVVRQAFLSRTSAQDVTEKWRQAAFSKGRDIKPDCVVTLDGSRNAIIEITLKDDPSEIASKGKYCQLTDYLDYDQDALGILVVGGEWKSQVLGGHDSKRVLIMDRERLIRFCSLAPQTRTLLLGHWLAEEKTEISYCGFSALADAS